MRQEASKKYIVTHTNEPGYQRKIASRVNFAHDNRFVALTTYPEKRECVFSAPFTVEEISTEQADEILENPGEFPFWTDFFAKEA